MSASPKFPTRRPAERHLPMRCRLALPVAVGVMTTFSSVMTVPRRAAAAPAAELWPRWQTHDANATRRVDHEAWAALLEHYVVQDPEGVNRVRYAALRAEGVAELEDYVASLAALDPDTLNRAEQMAYWINFYNALTVAVVVRHGPVDSIRDIDISPGLFADGPWRKKLVEVNGISLSLDDIEHRILRPIWQDPRVHYAVNCAAVGCPNLQTEPFTSANLEAMLERGARAYVNDPRGLALTTGLFGNELVAASRIYDWFVADFGNDEAGVLAHLRRHATPETAAMISDVEGIDAYRYEWALNDHPT